MKTKKRGIKIYVVAESNSGYVSCLIPYFGKRTTDSLIRSDLPITKRIVLSLVKILANINSEC